MKNNKGKRILAIIGIVILAGLYLTTLGLAIFGNENTDKLFTASVVATIIVPILMYIYSWIYKLIKKDVQDSAAKYAVKNDNENIESED